METFKLVQRTKSEIVCVNKNRLSQRRSCRSGFNRIIFATDLRSAASRERTQTHNEMTAHRATHRVFSLKLFTLSFTFTCMYPSQKQVNGPINESDTNDPANLIEKDFKNVIITLFYVIMIVIVY